MKGPSCREQACYSHHAALWHVAHDIIKQESDAGSHRLPCAVLRDILAHVICNPFRGEDRLAIRVRSENNGKGHQVAVHVCAITWKVETPEPLSAFIFENRRTPRSNPWLLEMLATVIRRKSCKRQTGGRDSNAQSTSSLVGFRD